MIRRIRNKLRNMRLIDVRQIYRLWEIETLKKVFARYDIDCVFDIGAHGGEYATRLRRDVGYHGLIFSFEPQPNMARRLESASAGDSKWIVFPYALSHADGEAVFNVMRDTQFSSFHLPSHERVQNFEAVNEIVATVSVSTMTLQSGYEIARTQFAFDHPFLKLDTQGSDVEILQASQDAARQFIALQSELSIEPIYDHSVDFRRAIEFYESLGFSLCAFVPNNAGHFPRLIETDCVMIRSDLLGDI